MFHLDLPNVYKVLSNSEFDLDEKLGGKSGEAATEKEDEKKCNKQIIVVSIFGTTLHHVVQRARFKRAFQLALDGFGTLSLYSDNEKKAGDGRGDKSRGSSEESSSSGGEKKDASNDGEEGGKGSGSENPCKAEETEEDKTSPHLTPENVTTGGILEGFFNEDESVLFLHIEGLAFDAAACMEACQHLQSSMKQSGFLSVWSSFSTAYCKWLLLLFSLSHIMILSETGGSFDTSYISLFRALDALRQDSMSSVSKILATIEGLPKLWIDHGRLCSPRLLFLFEVESENPTKLQTISSLTPCPMKQRKDLLQNDIYQVFRKCRIITNISANSLFAVPAADDFVYIFDKSAQNAQSVSESFSYSYLNYIASIATTNKKLQSQKMSSGPLASARSSSNTALPVKMSFRAHQDALTYSDSVNGFRSFLLEHISTALDKGFEDDYRRVSGNKHFFVRPSLEQWKAAYELLFKQLIKCDSQIKRISDAYVQLERFIHVDIEYLEIQCSELFPKVLAAYQRGLPDFYTAQQHQAKLTYAVNVFLNISRGPGVLPWLKKLATKCERYWKNGRQQCETLSLLGHVCANPIHRVRRKDHLEIIPLPEMDNELPETSHNSSTRLTSYCNCGKRQGSREEPFTIREANYEFYKKLAKDCCDKFEAYEFPVFSASEEENPRELSIQEMLVILKRKSETDSTTPNNIEDEKSANSFGLQSQDQELPEVFEAELRQENSPEEDSDDSSEEDVGVEDTANDNQNPQFPQQQQRTQKLKSDNNGLVVGGLAQFKRSSSTVEYLPGMFHTKSPPGLLTLFPSWSLVCLGPSSLYSHSHGVHQPGFVNGTNVLLPWDVKVKAEKGVTFVPPQKNIRGRRHIRQKIQLAITTSSVTIRDSLPGDEFSVKVFFGFEYECRKGHRFFCDCDSVLNTLNYSVVSQKTISAKVIASDMPLYFSCPCKEGREGRQIAQLLRIHVVTPKAPVFVTLNPKVQPGPVGTCPIFSTNEGPIKLTPSTYWVLRLPFSYVGDVVYVPPTDVSRYNGRLLKGIFNVISMNPGETEEWEKQNQSRM